MGKEACRETAGGDEGKVAVAKAQAQKQCHKRNSQKGNYCHVHTQRPPIKSLRIARHRASHIVLDSLAFEKWPISPIWATEHIKKLT